MHWVCCSCCTNIIIHCKVLLPATDLAQAFFFACRNLEHWEDEEDQWQTCPYLTPYLIEGRQPFYRFFVPPIVCRPFKNPCCCYPPSWLTIALFFGAVIWYRTSRGRKCILFEYIPEYCCCCCCFSLSGMILIGLLLRSCTSSVPLQIMSFLDKETILKESLACCYIQSRAIFASSIWIQYIGERISVKNTLGLSAIVY